MSSWDVFPIVYFQHFLAAMTQLCMPGEQAIMEPILSLDFTSSEKSVQSSMVSTRLLSFKDSAEELFLFSFPTASVERT